ncbi:MAG: PepSY domain-containing protein [Wenzhouxiangellaceae bacterium]|nr:PepSY domain-containing protein [Wenzhouxiangellaceae bacterium]
MTARRRSSGRNGSNGRNGALPRWHRWTGLVLGLPAVLLAVTGIAVNHADRLGLVERSVTSRALLEWYGVEPPDDAVAFDAGGTPVSQLGTVTFIDGRRLAGARAVPFGGRLVGAVRIDPVTVIALAEGLLLTDPAGRIIDRIPAAEWGSGGITGLGRTARSGVALRLERGQVRSDPKMLEWHAPAEGAADPDWVRPVPVTPALEQTMREAWSAGALSWERVMLDLHSGRLFGSLGPLLMDLVALALVALAATGAWTWWKRRRGSGRGGDRSRTPAK